MSLPTEIHYHLQSFLDHATLLNLSATNQYFRSLCPATKVKESLLCLEKCSSETETILIKKQLLPCYTCLKGWNSSNHFPRISHDEKYEMGSEKASSRVCATCLISTRPEVIYKSGMDREETFLFLHYGAGAGKCRLYVSRYGSHNHLDNGWLACPKCKLVTRYLGSPFSRRRRYDEAMLLGDMCAACYQPVWDKENEERRERKNARSRQRYREKKEEAKRKRRGGKRMRRRAS